jgi:hypothetical protein
VEKALTKTFSFKLNKEDAKTFVNHIDKNDLNASAFIRRAVKEQLEKK